MQSGRRFLLNIKKRSVNNENHIFRPSGFEVLVDGEQKYYHDAPNTRNNEGNCVDVDITGAFEITLRVGNGGNSNSGDHADWCDAYFIQPAGHQDEDNTVNGIKLHDLTGISEFNEETLLSITTAKTFTASNGQIVPYRIYLPTKYTAGKKYPVVVFFHGAGNRGTDNKGQIKDAIPLFDQLFQKEKNGEEFIIVAPQCPSNSQWVDYPWGTNYSIDAVAESKIMKASVELIESLKTTYGIRIRISTM